ncbi:MAG TPA: lysophospholipid acyltransferase family protein [Candidatus Polarisedimenticolia bacterium]|nr:lysophospholipid acyltransferase family protein [Candidatus Polarisedimenticolia bacterium]
MIRSFLVVLLFALAIILVLPWLMLWTLIVGDPNLMYSLAVKVVRGANRLAGMRVRIEGVENIPPGACVFAANHVSNVDPLALVVALPRRVSILVKRELFRIPVFSAAMRLAQFVPVDRSRKEGAAIVDAAVRYLQQGVSFVVFAEGTRSPDGRLRPFKRGAFTMAIEARVPVVPVSIVGTQRIMTKGEWALHPGEVTVSFGSAVDAAEYTIERRAELIARVESLVAASLPLDQQPLRQACIPE